jgi:branched-chain amino acid transport system ATP-binding protein
MAEPLLKVQGLVKRFGGLVATDKVSLDIRHGEIHALIGPNGAGKTTLIAQLSGSLASDAGRLGFDGSDISALPQHERVRRGLARSYQITSIFKKFSVLDNVALAVQARSGTSMSFWRPLAAETALFEEAAELVRRVGLGGREHAMAGNLAHGEQRQLEVGLALATQPKLILLDEPMAGMGPEESVRIIELIEKVREEVTVLLVEHDMDAVFRLADRISVLVNGRLIATGEPETIRNNPEVRKAYLGDELDEGAAA